MLLKTNPESSETPTDKKTPSSTSWKKENLPIMFKTENESLQILNETELEVNMEMLEKDDDSTKKGYEEN